MKQVNKISNLDVTVQAPASKAHTLRALVIGSLADGRSVIHNPLFGQDQLNLIESLKRLGVKIEQNGNTLTIYGVGGKFSPINDELDVGESGVAMNFLTSGCCLCDKPVTITGAKRITERPILEVVAGLKQLGCKIEYLEREGYPPIKVYPGFKGGNAQINGQKTSQYFSSIAICSPYAENSVILCCLDDMTERPYFDISLQMMSRFGVKASNDEYKKIAIPNTSRYAGREFKIEGDYSSASFFFLAAAICRSKVVITGLNPKSAQADKVFLTLLEKMGCHLSINDNSIAVTGQQLSAIEADMSNAPDLVPPIAIAAAFAKGTSRFTNIAHLRDKECDRLSVMTEELKKMGAKVKCDDDSLIVEGTNFLSGTTIDPHNDHRIAMSFAVAGLVTGRQIIEDEKCVAKSFPDFWEKFKVFEK
jgi:3-phosphoshikimate 1-carboxyvinyltransferase